MIFKEKEITLKNGTTAILKSPVESDAEQLLNMIKQACGETDYLIRYPEEWCITVEQEQRWINNFAVAENGVCIVCYINDIIAGNCQINFGGGIKTKHSATIGISVLKDYWGLGIGSAMFKEMIIIAKERGVKIIELGVIEGNERAINLYEKYGFKIVCKRPNAFMLKDGTMQSEIYMQKSLGE